MIDRQHGRICIECDSCDSVMEGERGDEFAVVWARAKEDGWQARKFGNDWVHACPNCLAGQGRLW